MFDVGDIVEVIGPDITGEDWGPDCFGVGAVLVVRGRNHADKEWEYKCGYMNDDIALAVWFPETSLKLVENS